MFTAEENKKEEKFSLSLPPTTVKDFNSQLTVLKKRRRCTRKPIWKKKGGRTVGRQNKVEAYRFSI